MRRRLSLKSDTCTESMDVDAAGISVKVGRITRGDLPTCNVLLTLRGVRMGWQKSAEGIVGLLDQAEGPNMNYTTGA
ncbi:MAG TPA: hypothetical protein VMW42_00135 [Desulfatiglandales bacterium]|nr:hypothetical protein [Desulfatiglandales bacterium]